MNRNNMPLVLMLAAGAVTCVITYINDYPMLNRLVTLLIVLLLFYFLGSLMKWTLDYFDSQNEKKSKEEGEVIEKDTDVGSENKEETGSEE